MSVPEFVAAEEDHVKRERSKAREMRKSQWWRQRRGQGECYYCKKRYKPALLTMDHIVPIIRGGKTSKSNVVSACKACNAQKKYLLPSEWQAHLDRLALPT